MKGAIAQKIDPAGRDREYLVVGLQIKAKFSLQVFMDGGP